MFSLAGLISTFSIIPAFIVAILKYGKNPLFRPFCLLIFLGSVIDITNLILGRYNYNNLWLFNIFILGQYYFVIYQFYKWGFFNSRSLTAKGTLIVITVIWIVESCLHSFSLALNEYSLIFSSFFIVIFTTIYINQLIFEKIVFLLKDPRFLLSVGLLIYFTINMLVFIFAIPQFNISGIFFKNVWVIHDFINTFTNLIFAAGLLCIQKK
jgi:hypothetical protein